MKGNILLLGADERCVGGVSAVNRTIINSKGLNEKYNIKILRTWTSKNWIKQFVYSLLYVKKETKNINLIHIDVSVSGSCFRKTVLTHFIGGKKYIVHLHSGAFFDFYSKQSKLYQSQIRKMFQNAQRVICVSNVFVKDVNEYLKVPKSKIDVVYNGVDVITRKISKDSNKLHVLYMGSISKERGIEDYLYVADYFSGNEKIIFYVAGQGDRYDFSQHNVNFLGIISGDEKERILNETDIFVNFAKYESFGIAMIECMNHGACIIGSNNGSIPEILENGKCGVLVNTKEEILEGLINLEKDRSMLSAFQLSAYRRSLDFDISRFEKGMDSVYGECIS